jgi:hypothetical protein
MTYDCFGNPTPGIPPSIADDFASIVRYAPIPWAQRDAYHMARVDALIGRGDPEIAWSMLCKMKDELWRLEDKAREQEEIMS